jgi:hypothetical protein
MMQVRAWHIILAPWPLGPLCPLPAPLQISQHADPLFQDHPVSESLYRPLRHHVSTFDLPPGDKSVIRGNWRMLNTITVVSYYSQCMLPPLLHTCDFHVVQNDGHSGACTPNVHNLLPARYRPTTQLVAAEDLQSYTVSQVAHPTGHDSDTRSTQTSRANHLMKLGRPQSTCVSPGAVFQRADGTYLSQSAGSTRAENISMAGLPPPATSCH